MIDLLITLRNMLWFSVCFQDFLVHCRSLIVAADRVTVAFNIPGITRTIALHISRFLTGCDMLVLLTDLSFMDTVVDGFEWLEIRSHCRSALVMAVLLSSPFSGLLFPTMHEWLTWWYCLNYWCQYWLCYCFL